MGRVLMLAVMVGVGTFLPRAASASTVALPGTPCADLLVPASVGPCTGGPIADSLVTLDPTFNLVNDPGTLDLGIFVVPGDVVLCETDPFVCAFGYSLLGLTSAFSDVVRFANGPNSSTATTYPDGENGPILPRGFVLSGNVFFISETTVGNGDNSDFTVYKPDANTTYNIHSDAALTHEPPDPNESPVPEPASVTLLALGLAGLAARRRAR